mgnify:CR=1 FL=1
MATGQPLDEALARQDGEEVILVSQGDLFAVDTRRERVRQLTRHPSEQSSPRYVDKEQGLIYLSEQHGPAALYRLNKAQPDGLFSDPGTLTEQKLLAMPDAAISKPTLSPDGKQLAFVVDGQAVHLLDLASGKLHGFLQSPLNDGKADYTTSAVPDATGKSENVRDYARFVRWVEFDPTTEKTRLFALPVDSSWYNQGKTGNAKFGDVVSLGKGKFIAIEQGTGKDKKVFNDLVLIEFPANATDITELGSDLEKSSLTGKPACAQRLWLRRKALTRVRC